MTLNSVGWATPPVSIDLSYDPNKGILHVEAGHPTQNLEKNFIRLMIVYVNGQQASSFNYFRQAAYDKFTDDVTVTANAGDVVKVDLFSAEGGEMAKEMTVQGAGTEAQPAQNADNSTAKAGDPFIHDVTIEGFVLGDKGQFRKMFRPYRNKNLTKDDMDALLQKIQNIYEREGYLQLVTITYQVKKHRLVYTVSMTS
jgi:hypothetical protein